MAAGDITVSVDAASAVTYRVDRLVSNDPNTVPKQVSAVQVAPGANAVIAGGDENLQQIIITPVATRLVGNVEVATASGMPESGARLPSPWG